jgi:hypothetical protein
MGNAGLPRQSADRSVQMTPQLVSHFAVDAVFPRVAQYLAPALGLHTAWTVADLATICSNRGAWLFIDCHEDPKAALVGRFEVWGGKPVFNILAMGSGVNADWPEAMDTIQDWANTFGVKQVVFHGRKGWQRTFENARVIFQTYVLEYED